jgi:hypothetical protein
MGKEQRFVRKIDGGSKRMHRTIPLAERGAQKYSEKKPHQFYVAERFDIEKLNYRGNTLKFAPQN